ncbi:U3 small nucleolar ribonucleoprotein protein MPP10-like isoform X2 [Saccostrea echinata]|uniref:U3 small nucleolar ribonucleoprotein protein MPP10-like isoform X2 n=1 Tax=Saccostrea echinata TaxID=191078 RepID=UPI002A815FF8|nr:U3 small nucleolar ribonucleoprotein protein MPP10-like isoform X2 [Saccostrea echinata]
MATHMENLMSKILRDFLQCASKPEEFLSAQPQLFAQLKNITKSLYDLSKSEEFGQVWSESALPELIVDNFDEEQIWQQLELQNSGVIDHLLTKISHLVTAVEKQPTERLKCKSDKSYPGDKRTVSFEEVEKEEEENIVSDDSDRIVFKGNNVLDIESDDDSEIDFKFPESNLTLLEDRESETDEENLINKETSKSKGMENKKRQGRSVVDDKFFKLADMESFLEQEDAREERRRRGEESDEDEEDVDMFADIPSDEEEGESGKQMYYEDFFDPPEEMENSDKQKKKSKDSKRKDHQEEKKEEEGEMFEEEEMDEDDGTEEEEGDDIEDDEEEDIEEDNAIRQKPKDLLDSDSEGEDPDDVLGRKPQEKSTFEKQQAQLRKKIIKMEEASLAEKQWQLAGEIGATDRPENSLLEEHLMYDQTVRLPPVITEETTQSLESIIIQRIKDKAFDDVERKVKPKENPFEYKKRIVLDQEKSKISLGEVYEQEYLKQQKEEGEEKTEPQHEEIKSMMQSLFVKLDALSNFHYTPKAAAPEVKIVTNLPSIMMEEVAPVTQGDGTLLAPEEIKDKKRGELKGKTEETETDRKSQRRNKKAEKRKRLREKKRRQALVEKLNPGLGNKYSKEKAIKELEKSSKSGSGVTMLKEDKHAGKQKLGSSRSFFTQLQEDAQSQIKKRKTGPSSKKTVQKSAKVYKL